MTNDRLIWFKGSLMPVRDAKVDALSPTAQFGLNVFEGIRGYWQDSTAEIHLVRLDQHLHRLDESCRLIGLDCPYSHAEILQAIESVIEADDYRADLALRATVFVDGFGTWHSSSPTDMFIAPIERSRSDLTSLSSRTACVSAFERINERSMPPTIKAGANYLNSRYAQLDAIKRGYDAPIMLSFEGKVSESAGSCVFLVKDGELITPRVTDSILNSITRACVIELAGDMGVVTHERAVEPAELAVADEVFLCGTAAELTPVSSVDGVELSGGSPGTLTTKLLSAYLSAASGQDEKYHHWLTAVAR